MMFLTLGRLLQLQAQSGTFCTENEATENEATENEANALKQAHPRTQTANPLLTVP